MLLHNEPFLYLAYIVGMVGFAYGVDRLCPRFGPPNLDMAGCAAAFFGVLGLVGLGLTALLGAMPPWIIHGLAQNGWRLPHPLPSDFFGLGLFGKLAQVVGAFAALFVLFRAWPLALLAYGGFFALSQIYHW